MSSEASPDVRVPPLPELFREYAPYLWRVIRRLGVAEAEADDLCQEVFLTAHRKRGDFEGRSSVKTWLYGICLRTVSDWRRRAHVRHEDLVAKPPDPGAAPEQMDALDRERARRLLDQALAALDDDRRATFVLYEIEELPLRRVAEIMDVPLQTVYSRLKSARRHVEEVFRQAWGADRNGSGPSQLAGGNA